MLNRKKILFSLMVVGFLSTVWALPSMAGYYDGKTITVILGGNAGSGLDLNCRFFTQHWEKHFPGKTKLIVKNMPGGGAVKGFNFIYEKARPDGMTVTYGNPNFMGVLTGQPGIRYKIEELGFIGGANGSFVTLVRTDKCPKPTDIDNVTDLVVGGINPSLTLDTVSQLSLDLLGVKYRYVTGFRGMPKIKTALLSNEIHFSTTGYAGYRNFFKDTSLKSGELTMIWAHPMFDSNGNPIKTNVFPGARPFVEVYKELRGEELSGSLYESYKFLTNFAWRFVNNVFTPPGTPAEAVSELRRTFKATFEDPAFQAAWEKQYGVQFTWIDGETGQEIVNTYRQISPEAVDNLVKYKVRGVKSKRGKK